MRTMSDTYTANTLAEAQAAAAQAMEAMFKDGMEAVSLYATRTTGKAEIHVIYTKTVS